MNESAENIALGLLISYYRGGGVLSRENAYESIVTMLDVATAFVSVIRKNRKQDKAK